MVRSHNLEEGSGCGMKQIGQGTVVRWMWVELYDIEIIVPTILIWYVCMLPPGFGT